MKPMYKEISVLTKLLAAPIVLWSLAGSAIAWPDEDAGRDLLHLTFDKPEAKLDVAPVVALAGYAIAGWTQGETGGRALLQARTLDHHPLRGRRNQERRGLAACRHCP
jgi:hypothetical protein